MPRFIDHLLAEKKWKHESFDLPPEIFENADELLSRNARLRQDFRTATVLSIDNVAQYYFKHHATKDGRMDGPEQFPQLAPPFPCAFYEYDLEPSMYDLMFTEGETSQPRQLNQAGILVQSCDVAQFRNQYSDGDSFLQESRSDVTAKWVLFITVFARHKSDRELGGPLLMLMLAVGEDGQATSKLRSRIWGVRDDAYDQVAQEDIDLICLLADLAFPAFLATSFLHCRNVSTEDNVPPPKLSKAYNRRHGQPLLRFKTLSIEPMKHILRKQGQVEDRGLTYALHLCRGHFKDYRNSAGLFGRHKGLFWWDLHTRGSLDQGAVVKDYAINLTQ